MSFLKKYNEKSICREPNNASDKATFNPEVAISKKLRGFPVGKRYVIHCQFLQLQIVRRNYHQRAIPIVRQILMFLPAKVPVLTGICPP